MSFAVVKETLLAGLGIYWAISQFEKWEEDIDNIKALVEKYVEIGLESQADKEALDGVGPGVFGYAESMPEYAACGTAIRRAKLDALIQADRTHEPLMLQLSEDDFATRCMINRKIAKTAITDGMMNMADAKSYENSIIDRYVKARLSAISGTISGSPPNIGRAMDIVGKTSLQAAREHAGQFNSALGVVGRSVSSLYNRYNQRSTVSRDLDNYMGANNGLF